MPNSVLEKAKALAGPIPLKSVYTEPHSGPQRVPQSKGGKTKHMTSYIPGRLPATADPRVVKTPKCKSHVQGNCPASSLTHKHHRPHIAQQEPPQKSSCTTIPVVDRQQGTRDEIASRRVSSSKSARRSHWKSGRRSKARLCEIDFRLPGVPYRPGNGVSTDMGVSTESFLSELEVYEDDDVNSAMDETHSVPGTHSAWRICQEGPHHTHVLDIPILAWPDLSSGSEASRPRSSCSSSRPSAPPSSVSMDSDTNTDSYASDWEHLTMATLKGPDIAGNFGEADSDDDTWEGADSDDDMWASRNTDMDDDTWESVDIQFLNQTWTVIKL